MFMTVVTTSYILVAPSPEGFGLGYDAGIWSGIALAALFTALFARYAGSLRRASSVAGD